MLAVVKPGTAVELVASPVGPTRTITERQLVLCSLTSALVE